MAGGGQGYPSGGGINYSTESMNPPHHQYTMDQGSTANLNEKHAPGTTTTNNAQRSRKSAGGSSFWTKKKTLLIIGGVIATLVIIGAVVGGVVASKVNKSKDGNNDTASGLSNDAAGASIASAMTTVTTTLPNGATTTVVAGVAATAAAAASASVSPLPTYDWTKSSYAGALAASSSSNSNSSTSHGPMVGVALGSWLILEQWMVEPWFNASANNASVVDEWNLMLALGDSAQSVMTEHYSTFVTEADIEAAHQAGMNTLRIPIGFWAFVDTVQGEPYLSNGGQLDFLEQAMYWAYKRGMYVVVDLHGLPGSQNGEVTSGHLTTNPTFFQDANLARADATVDAALAWITASPYRSVVSALGVANEPRPYTQAQVNMLQAYYQRSYEKSMNLSNPVPIQFHHGFVNQILNVSYIDYWSDFVADKNPKYIAMESHPYVGTFPLQDNQSDMLKQVCDNAAKYANFTVPIVITEWSLRTGVSDASFEKEFYTQQVTAWAESGGSIFWSIKAVNGSANGGDNTQYSFLDLVDRGIVPMPSSGQSTVEFLKTLGSPCGTPSTVSWAS